MAREDALVVEEFVKVMLEHLKGAVDILPAIVPQSKEDEQLLIDGKESICKLIYELEHCESIREYDKFIDIPRVVEDFDTESIKTLNYKINNTARNSLGNLYDKLNTD